MSSSPKTSSTSNGAANALAATGATGQNNGSGGNNRSALQRRSVDPFVERLRRAGEAREEHMRRLREEQAEWNAEQAEWNEWHERRMAEAARRVVLPT